MMLVIFALVTSALLAALLARHAAALVLLLVCLVLAAGLFLYEVHSPESGFAMPWLQVRAAPVVGRLGA